jgi:hypothetical protein
MVYMILLFKHLAMFRKQVNNAWPMEAFVDIVVPLPFRHKLN